jgi:hypothetical protein
VVVAFGRRAEGTRRTAAAAPTMRAELSQAVRKRRAETPHLAKIRPIASASSVPGVQDKGINEVIPLSSL